MHYDLAKELKTVLFLRFEAQYGRLWSYQFDKVELGKEVEKIWIKVIANYTREVVDLAMELICENQKCPSLGQFKECLKEAQKQIKRQFSRDEILKEKKREFRPSPMWLLDHMEVELNKIRSSKHPDRDKLAGMVQKWINSIVTRGVLFEEGDEELWRKDFKLYNK